MNDENPETSPPSGSRWEPTEPQSAAQGGPEHPEQSEHSAPPAYAAAPPAGRASWITRTRSAVAAGAVAVLVAGGLGGFALGRASAGGDGDGARFDRQGVPSGFERGDGDGRGLPGGPGLAPPNGQVPGSNGTDDGQDSSGTDTQNS
jgi:hypothetical protein